ncbi:MAG: iron ABC transporter permease [Rubrivivax sp.]|nr:iron ABC transporter permease [Rubrivivax sp.]
MSIVRIDESGGFEPGRAPAGALGVAVARWARRAARALLALLCLALVLPVLAVVGSWLAFDEAAAGVLRHQAATVLPEYAGQTLVLALGTGLGVLLLGATTAALVTLTDFPGRRVFEWALLLPLAMPAYVLAYAWTDALQFSSPLQGALREWLGRRGALWPDVRNAWSAAALFVLCLYPYVYLLARAALGERAVQMMEAARLLGAPLRRRVWAVALPMARPALAAGTALALMEVLADYGVGAYFGLATFSTGIYKAWLVMNDRVAALQLASALLLGVAVLLLVERRAQQRLRFSGTRAGAQHAGDARPLRLAGWAAWAALALCVLPVLLGFVLPVAWLLWLVWQEAQAAEFGLPLARFAQWGWASFKLAALAALLATALALALAFVLRRGRGALLRAGARVLALGYAMPGVVVGIGVLAPLAWVQQQWPQSGLVVLATGTVFGVLYAYLVRFCAVALQSVEAGYSRIPRSVDDTALLLGSGAVRVFGRLHLPLLKRSVLAALLLVFVDVMKELPATLLLRPFGSDTLAVVAYNFARDERLAEAALPSLAIVAVGLIPVLLLSRAMRAPDG